MKLIKNSGNDRVIDELRRCLTPQATLDIASPTLAPAGETQVVFRDSAFADDIAKTNLTAILQQYGLANVRSL